MMIGGSFDIFYLIEEKNLINKKVIVDFHLCSCSFMSVFFMSVRTVAKEIFIRAYFITFIKWLILSSGNIKKLLAACQLCVCGGRGVKKSVAAGWRWKNEILWKQWRNAFWACRLTSVGYVPSHRNYLLPTTYGSRNKMSNPNGSVLDLSNDSDGEKAADQKVGS